MDVKNRRWAGHQQAVPLAEKVGSALALALGLAVIIFAFTVLPRVNIHMSLLGMPSAKTLVQNEIGRMNNACAKEYKKECAYLDAVRQ